MRGDRPSGSVARKTTHKLVRNSPMGYDLGPVLCEDEDGATTIGRSAWFDTSLPDLPNARVLHAVLDEL